jgi:hypothetical protein
MPYFLLYLVKFSLSLALLYIFYQLVLRRLTFYTWNRWCLLGYSALSFVVPFINISSMLEDEKIQAIPVFYYIPSLDEFTNGKAVSTLNSPGLNYVEISIVILIAGIVILFTRLLVRLASYAALLRQSRLVSKNGISLYEVNKTIIPFSFGNSIFINPGMHSEKELEEIIRHEFVHVKQKHTIDILWAEILCIINWYNPFAWLLRKSIRQNLEFIADDKVLQNGINKKEYQYLLLKVIGNNQFSIASQFNFSSLKKRIAMMNKIKSARVHLTKFAFLVPLLAVLLLAFRSSMSNRTKSLPALPAYSLKDTVWPVNNQGYNVSVAGINGHCTVLVRDKKGKEVNKVDLLKWKEKAEEFETKYGTMETPENVYTAIAAQEATEPTVTIAPFSAYNTNIFTLGPAGLITGDEDIVVTITKTTTTKELDEIIQQMKDKGIEMVINNKNYDNGNLTAVSGTLKANESKSNFTATDFKNLKLAVVKREGKFYFKIVVNDPNFC